MFDTFTRYTLIPLVIRLGLAVIFVYHGLHKVADEGNELGAAWMRPPPEQSPKAPEQSAKAPEPPPSAETINGGNGLDFGLSAGGNSGGNGQSPDAPDMHCAHCGQPGGFECAYDDRQAVVHPHCRGAWVAAQEASLNRRSRLVAGSSR